MLIIPQAEMDEVLDRKTRRRTLTLPVRRESLRVNTAHPRTGQTLTSPDAVGGSAIRRCPVKTGGNYQIRGDGIDRTYERLRQQAASQPSRARALTWLLARAEYETRELRITVHTVRQQQDRWHVGFYLDSKRSIQESLDDAPVFLRRSSGYTVTHDEIDAGAVMGPLAEDLEEARKKAREMRGLRRVEPGLDQLARATRETLKCRDVMNEMKRATANRLRRVEKDLAAIREELIADARATVSLSDRVPLNTPHHTGVSPCDTESVVSLRSAA